ADEEIAVGRDRRVLDLLLHPVPETAAGLAPEVVGRDLPRRLLPPEIAVQQPRQAEGPERSRRAEPALGTRHRPLDTVGLGRLGAGCLEIDHQRTHLLTSPGVYALGHTGPAAGFVPVVTVAPSCTIGVDDRLAAHRRRHASALAVSRDH